MNNSGYFWLLTAGLHRALQQRTGIIPLKTCTFKKIKTRTQFKTQTEVQKIN